MTGTPIESCRIRISEKADIARAIIESHSILDAIGFGRTQRFLIATAISELARNIFLYAESGTIDLEPIEAEGRRGVAVIAEDRGPGIADIELALTEGYSTGNTLGLGLPGVRRIMDEFHIDPERTTGTRILTRKWL